MAVGVGKWMWAVASRIASHLFSADPLDLPWLCTLSPALCPLQCLHSPIIGIPIGIMLRRIFEIGFGAVPFNHSTRWIHPTLHLHPCSFRWLCSPFRPPCAQGTLLFPSRPARPDPVRGSSLSPARLCAAPSPTCPLHPLPALRLDRGGAGWNTGAPFPGRKGVRLFCRYLAQAAI